MRVAQRADRIVEDHPTRRVQQEAGNREALLLLERQLSIPAVRTVERGHKVAEVHPLQRGDHGSLIEVPGLCGIAHRVA